MLGLSIFLFHNLYILQVFFDTKYIGYFFYFITASYVTKIQDVILFLINICFTSLFIQRPSHLFSSWIYIPYSIRSSVRCSAVKTRSASMRNHGLLAPSQAPVTRNEYEPLIKPSSSKHHSPHTGAPIEDASLVTFAVSEHGHAPEVESLFMFRVCLWISGMMFIVSLMALIISDNPVTISLIARNWWILVVELGMIMILSVIYIFNMFHHMNETFQLVFLFLSLFLLTMTLCLCTVLQTTKVFITGAFFTSFLIFCFAVFSKLNCFKFSRFMWMFLVVVMVLIMWIIMVFVPYVELFTHPSSEWLHPPQDVFSNSMVLFFTLSYTYGVIFCLDSFRKTMNPTEYRAAAFKTIIYVTFISVMFFRSAIDNYRTSSAAQDKILVGTRSSRSAV